MDRSIVLANIDDVCTEVYLDVLLGVKTHKMELKVGSVVKPRPIHKRITTVHRAMYEEAVSEHSRVKFVLCDYLPDHNLYKSLMVVSKCFIKKQTVLFEVGGHHFPIERELITAGVNDFSIIYSGKSRKKIPHLLLGPIAFVNHCCVPNCIFVPHENGKTYLKAVNNFQSGQEITVQYSTEYFRDTSSKFLCEVCTAVYDLVEDVIEQHQAPSSSDDEKEDLYVAGPSRVVVPTQPVVDDVTNIYVPGRSTVVVSPKNNHDFLKCRSKKPVKPLSFTDISSDDFTNILRAVENRNIKDAIGCPFCPKSFRYISHWLRHIAIHVEPQWKCDICNLKFTREDTMMRHRERHEEKRYVFPCQRCPNEYLNYDSLKQHVKQKHTKNPKLFKCNVCEKKCLSKKTLTYHLNVHGSITPFECTICKQKFHQPYQKSRHIKKMHPV